MPGAPPSCDLDKRRQAGLPKLRWLNLWNTFVDDDALDHIARMAALEDLVLDGTMVTDEGLAKLKACKKLKTLSVTQTSVTPEAIDVLQSAVPGLKVTR